MDALPIGVAFSRDIGCQAIDSNPALLALLKARPEENLSASAPDPKATGRWRTRYFSGGPGQGSEFVVTLPLCSELNLSRSPAEPKRITEGPPARKRRILVVDDNPDIADSFKILLETMGHQVRVLNAGSESLAVIRELRPEVVFLDICMPDMGGYQVAAGIRAAGLYPRPMLVALTGYGRDSDRETALESGFDHHLLKPVVPVQIEALLAELD